MTQQLLNTEPLKIREWLSEQEHIQWEEMRDWMTRLQVVHNLLSELHRKIEPRE